MSISEIGICRGRPRLTVEEGDQLLPGIPNDITMNHIVTKLQWRAFHVLSLVSHGWREAIRSHEVHDARVQSESTDTVLVIHSDGHTFLYFVRDKYCCKLPEIPTPSLCTAPGISKWKALDGKIYFLGGRIEADEELSSSNAVFVLDMAGPRVWKQCASMESARQCFGCGTIDGKIYVFFGVKSILGVVSGSEVYDQKEDSWSEISPMRPSRYNCEVAALGEELILYGGLPYCGDEFDEFFSWDVYHPVTDKWTRRVVPRVARSNLLRTVFCMNGALYVMCVDGMDGCIYVYNYIANTWSDLQTCSFAGVAGVNDSIVVLDIVAMKDELLAVVRNKGDDQHFLLQSDGFPGDKKRLLWERQNYPLPFGDSFAVLCSFQL